MPPEDVIGTLHQKAAEVDVASLGNTELRVSLSGLTPFRSQAEIATHIATSLETFFASQSQAEDESKISDPDALSDKAYWAYRSLHYNTHDADPTGPTAQMVTVVMKFNADFGTMTGQLEADSADAALQTDPKALPASQIFNYQQKAPGTWVAAVPIASDPKSTTALYTVANIFGFGAAL